MTSSTDRDRSLDILDASARRFVLWMLEALGLRLRSDEQGWYEISVPAAEEPEESPTPHPCQQMDGCRFWFAESRGKSDELPEDVEQVVWGSPLIKWLLDELQQGVQLVQGSAARQPMSVHELAEHLFAQYKVDDGHMRLAGCSLEDRPFLRLTFRQSVPAIGEPQLVQCFGTSDGELVEAALRESLELDDLTPVAGRAPKMDVELVRRWTDVTRKQYEAQQGEGELSLVAATLVWCKHAEGKLTFSIGKRTAEIPFSGWGRMFAERRSLPPPYQCPLSGKASYHLGATDDGRITVVEAIGVCTESSRRVLQDELQLCSVTGRMVLPEYLQECPCSGDLVLSSALEACCVCQQQVSPRSLVDLRCAACRQLQPVTRDNTDVARLLERYPKLGQLRSLKLSETATAFVLSGSSTWRRLLVVLDKRNLDVLHVATSRMLSSQWTPVGRAEREQWFDAQ